MALASPSVQAVPNPSNENWRPVGTVLSFELGDQSCGYGAHQTLRRDWRGEWW
jgi:hypothetical protein